MFLKIKLLFFFIFLISCQPVEFIDLPQIDNSRFEKISINAKQIEINVNYNSVFSEENIEDQIKNPPLDLLSRWASQNIQLFGNENKLKINILDASIVKKEIENVNAKKYEEKTIFKYSIFFLVEYNLYNDDNFLIANSTVESSRYTTSQKYISLNEREIIINELLFNSLNDFSKESKSTLKIYMGDFIQ